MHVFISQATLNHHLKNFALQTPLSSHQPENSSLFSRTFNLNTRGTNGFVSGVSSQPTNQPNGGSCGWVGLQFTFNFCPQYGFPFRSSTCLPNSKINKEKKHTKVKKKKRKNMKLKETKEIRIKASLSKMTRKKG